MLDVAQTLAGKRILFIGSTGFVGKVALSMLLRRYPGLGQVFAVVRPGAGLSAEERFFRKVAAGRPFDPIRDAFGGGTEAFLREKVRPVGGDVSQPNCGLSEADLGGMTGLDAVINCAGLVSFNPSLESALRINVNGVKNTIELCRRTGAALIHVSTCFVSGNRDGAVWEDEPVLGYFPRRPGILALSSTPPRRSELRDEDFSVQAEVADCERLIAQVRARADDRAHVSMFRDKGAERLLKEGRDPDDEKHLKAAVQRERKLWMAERLTELGMERAQHWGWPNTYTYTKSLGDQLCSLAAQPAQGENGGLSPLRVSIVRPAIVESAMSYPFPGWNEGFNTTAPLVFMALKGHLQIPASKDTILDVIPVDQVCAGLIAVTAATLAGVNQLVYQLGTSDSSPFRMARSVELTGLYRRKYYRARRDEGVLNRVRARMESFPVSKDRYQRASLPLWRGVFNGVSKLIEEQVPTWGAPRVMAFLEHAKERLDDNVQIVKQGEGIFDLFMPFVHDNAVIFRGDRMRALYQSLTPQDQVAIPWTPGKIEWRSYFMDVHLPGLEKWIFPSLDEEFQARPKTVYTYRDLLELFSAATKHYRGRTAMRLLPPPGPDGEPAGEGQRYTYRELLLRSARVGQGLRRLGVPAGGKVVLLSENRPEWGITYFGILQAGATCVPVDSQATLDEVVNIVRSCRAECVLCSEKVAARIDVAAGLLAAGLSSQVLGFQELDARVEPGLVPPVTGLVQGARADDMASLIYTSGTTGRPKGVMLTHRNFASLLAKLGSVFDIDKHDGLLSVLPLHHTFEFTAGLLMPLMRGAQISYLTEVTPEALSAAFRSSHVTGMVGVPALWQVLYRRITRQITDLALLDRLIGAPWALRIFEALVEGMRRLRDQAMDSLGVDLNLSKLLFLPIHRRMGGRVRLLISGGSALPAETMKSFRGLGFDLYEGYGLTEASPVLTVTRPGKAMVVGSVGEALPGVEVRIDQPDGSGVGEVIASGPNVMAGYYEDAEATAEALRDGYLRTGDLGRFDEEKRLYIVGRKKDVIIGLNGENVYPDELEEVYRDSPYVKELSIVGLPVEEGQGGETVACLLVPQYEPPGETLPKDEVRERAREHVRTTSTKLSLAKRVKVLQLTDVELPKTATRKVKRKGVLDELQRLGRVQKQAALREGDKESGGDWLLGMLAEISGKQRDRIQGSLQELGLDSLTYAELGVALEGAGIAVPENADLTSIATVADLQKQVALWGDKARTGRRPVKRESAPEPADSLNVPEPLRRLGNQGLGRLQRMLYEQLLETRVTGKAYVPKSSRFIVAANHASHLDMGLVKHALGDWGPLLVALAAKDYFFDDPLRRAYFENFTNLVPMDRYGSVRESLRLAREVIQRGNILLIFPEGTRSESGVMKEFKPSIGYLALHNQVDVLPMFLAGTHDALPKGKLLPQRRHITAHIGPVLCHEALQAAVVHLPKGEQNREAARLVELAVRKLAPPGVNRVAPPRTDGSDEVQS